MVYWLSRHSGSIAHPHRKVSQSSYIRQHRLETLNTIETERFGHIIHILISSYPFGRGIVFVSHDVTLMQTQQGVSSGSNSTCQTPAIIGRTSRLQPKSRCPPLGHTVSTALPTTPPTFGLDQTTAAPETNETIHNHQNEHPGLNGVFFFSFSSSLIRSIGKIFITP